MADKGTIEIFVGKLGYSRSIGGIKLRELLDVKCEPGRSWSRQRDAVGIWMLGWVSLWGGGVVYFAGTLMWLLSHARPSKMPSPVVAQLGSTFQMWFFAMTFRLRASETSFGRMAVCEKTCQQVFPAGVFESFLHPLTSCLLAKTSSRASFISRS
jgi:hypothetical protein